MFRLQFTSSEPSPKIVVRIGVENMVMMVNKTATPAVMKKMKYHNLDNGVWWERR